MSPPRTPPPAPDAFEAALANAGSLYFLCSGNVARSAFAELYARHRRSPLPVGSAAAVFRNRRILPQTARALAARGVPAAEIEAFRPRHLDELEPGPSPLALAMTDEHLSIATRLPALAGRTFLLEEACGGSGGIADPVLEGADFEATFERIAVCVDHLLERLRGRSRPDVRPARYDGPPTPEENR